MRRKRNDDGLPPATDEAEDRLAFEKDPAAPTRATSWSEEPESSRGGVARRAGRVALWGLVALMAVSGVRSWIAPKDSPPPVTAGNQQQDEKKNAVPELEAQQVAARFARSYLTWNEKAPAAREQELVGDLAVGADASMGWNGEGTQLVAQSIPGAVTQHGNKRAGVRVDVRVSTTNKSGSVSSWRGLEVPVAFTEGRVLVTGQPALVGLPEPVEYRQPKRPGKDGVLASQTRETVADFFTAWAEGSEDQVAAPGADIAPLGPGVDLVEVSGWTVDEGEGRERTGTATVRWAMAGAELQQTYRLTLTQVSANAATRWQVQQLTATS